jgi:hypothetical protein
MKATRLYYALLGIVLIVVGAIVLLQINGLIPDFEGPVWQIVWPSLFGLAGLAFLVLFITNTHDRWSAAIPALVLLGLSAVGFLGGPFGGQGGTFVLGALGGTLFLGAIGVGFLLVFLARREMWWALIPAGVMLSLAVVAGWTSVSPDQAELSGGVMFFGYALTFLAVYFARDAAGRRKWALIPAAACAVLGVIIIASTGNALWLAYLGPVALIVGGAYLLWRAYNRGGKTPSPKV